MRTSTRFRRHPRSMRIMACLLILLFLNTILYPTAAWALTSGPAQPEFTSFEPVVTTNMVNDFTGDFTYNLPVLQIPGPDGGGYALSLSYHSGNSPEDEASWVGYGWTLNPGAINRQMRGIPDDWNGHDDETITQWNKTLPNKTVSVEGSIANFEAFSFDVPANANATIRYNNYKGFGYSAGAGVALADGLINIGFNVTDGQGSFSLQVNPAQYLSNGTKKAKNKKKEIEDKFEANCEQKGFWAASSDYKKSSKQNPLKPKLDAIGNAYGFSAMTAKTFPLNAIRYTGESYTLSLGLMPTPSPCEFGMSGELTGRYSIQRNQESSTPHSYGYLYSSSASNDPSGAMDYHMENLTTYNKRDKFLSIPFSDADLFSVTGEGLSGSMRLYPRHVQHYRPAQVESKTDMFQVGAEFELGLNLGGGVDLSYGQQNTTVSNWNGNITSNGIDEPYFFRMTNDLGGYVDYGDGSSGTDEPENAHVASPGYSETISNRPMDAGNRAGRSSYVGYNTNAEMNVVSPTANTHYRSYEKTALSVLVPEPSGEPSSYDRSSLPGDQIGELSILNGQGQRYTYGLPIYAKKDANYSFSSPSTPSGDFQAHIEGAYGLDYQRSLKQFVGSENNGQYATSYLLTSITDPDYIDRTNDGPTFDDIGGYTKFIYSRMYPNTSASYRWRSPYNGYEYIPGELSECSDDLLSYSSGEKEVYYLDKVETRTHVAKFILGNDRQDSRGALPEGESAGTGLAMNYLDRIELYVKGPDGTPGAIPIKTVHFAYDYEAWPGSPNSTAVATNHPEYGSIAAQGRLTLKQIWTDYNGVINARIAPYKFDYKYPASSFDYPAPYNGTTSITSAYQGTDQAPAFDPEGNDAWGSYKANGSSRANNMRPWLDQRGEEAAPTFDPAAWQLKQITLPSGGEIQVQYEPDDYLFVQDQHAHAMCQVANPVPLSDGPPIYKLDLASILPSGGTPTEKNRILQLIRSIYVDGGKKMYFKFLYCLKGGNIFGANISINNHKQEFITGYVNIKSANISGQTIDLELGTGSLSNYSLPNEVCQSYYDANKRGKSLDCSNDPTDGDNQPVDIIENFVSFSVSGLLSNCHEIDISHSYFRIPVPVRKIGGGLRVKRLLMYDPQEGHPNVYGSEYIYKMRDEHGEIVSSGVATNEPNAIREENVLVRPLDRFNQSWFNRVIAGRDKTQSEGPLCEGMYPAPSVGYRQVIIRNIDHDQQTAPTFAVKQFNTALDYPVGWNSGDDGESGADMTDIDKQHEELNLFSGLFNRIINKAWLSQGFTIKLNSMNGVLKSDAAYVGSTDHFVGASTEDPPPLAVLLSETTYDYFKPGEDIPVQTDLLGHTVNKPMGKEVDIAMENRKVRDNLDDCTAEIDADVGVLLIPLPFFSLMPGMTISTSEINTHVISKVVSYPAILKRTRTHKDGIYHISENVAFDQYTGEPIKIRTNDGFLRGLENMTSLATATGGVYTQHAIPASYVYPDMGQAAKGEHKTIVTTSNQNPYLAGLAELSAMMLHVGSEDVIRLTPAPNGSICDAANALCIGDLFLLYTADPNATPDKALYYLTSTSTSVDGSPFLELHVEKASYSPSAIPSGTPLGEIFTVRSGSDNKLSPRVADFTVYGTGEAVAATNDHEWNNRTSYVAGLNAAVASLTVGNTSAPVNDPSVPPDPPLKFVGPGDGITITLNARRELVMNGCSGKPLPSPSQGNPFVLGADGLIYFMAPGMDCAPVLLDCPQFTAPHYLSSTIDQVVQCKASTFKDDWPYSNDEYGPTVPPLTDYESARKGRWRQESSYAYNQPMDQYDKNFNSGWFSMTQFNWANPAMNDDEWVKASTVTSYSPDGQALEETNALGIPSCVRFGYDRTLPYLTAQNAERANVLFESFEKTYTVNSVNTYEAGLPQTDFATRDPQIAHSGKASVSTTATDGVLFQGQVTQRSSPTSQGTIIKAWFRSVGSVGNALDPSGLRVVVGSTNIPMVRVGRSGEWALYQATIPPTSSTFTASIHCTNATSGTWMDDLRIQPVDAQMTTYVYDPDNFRLLTSFDDQHFGLYYQYNAEGKLVRKQVETEHGLKTIQETQYNTPLADRP